MLAPGETAENVCSRIWTAVENLSETADDILAAAERDGRLAKSSIKFLLKETGRLQAYIYDFYRRAFDEEPEMTSWYRPDTDAGKDVPSADDVEAVCVFETPGIIRCSTDVLPYLKNNATSFILSGILAEKFGNAVSQTVGTMDRWPAPVTYIFVNRFPQGTSGKQPYYDNDNILLKHYLDEIAPLVGGDDNCSSCNTLYTWQEDPASGFDVYAVRDGWLPEWARLHSNTSLGGQIVSGWLQGESGVTQPDFE